MKRLPGVILFVLLALVILQIVTLRVLNSAQQRITALEKKVEALQPAPTATAPAATVPAPAK